MLCCHKHAGAGRLAGELPEEARTDMTGRLPWAPANAASKHGWFTPRAMRRAKPVTGQCRSARRRRMRATSLSGSGMCGGLAAAGSIESSPTFPPGVFYLGLTSPPASHVSRNRVRRTPTYSQPTARTAHFVPCRLPIEFFLSNFPLPRHAADRTRLWARSLPVRVPCVQLAASLLCRGEQHPPDVSKIALCAYASRNPPEPGRSGRPQRNAAAKLYSVCMS